MLLSEMPPDVPKLCCMDVRLCISRVGTVRRNEDKNEQEGEVMDALTAAGPTKVAPRELRFLTKVRLIDWMEATRSNA
jgi:hypothetical protein